MAYDQQAADLLKQVSALTEENERLKEVNGRLTDALNAMQASRNDRDAQIKKLEGLLHKILKESVGGNVPFSFELYNEIKAALNL